MATHATRRQGSPNIVLGAPRGLANQMPLKLSIRVAAAVGGLSGLDVA